MYGVMIATTAFGVLLDILLLGLLTTRNSVRKGVFEIFCLLLVQKLNNVSKFEVVKARNLTYTEHI